MRRHLVRPGECFVSIAAAHGVPWRELWDHPANRSLRELRGNPNVLLPGDLVTITDGDEPTHRLSPGGTRRFRGRPAMAHLHLRLSEEGSDGESNGLSGAAFRLEAAGRTVTGTLGSDGMLRADVPASATAARLVLEPGSERERALVLHIGHLDPIASVAGIKQRLNNLGYSIDETTGDEALADALSSFQTDRGLDASGALDDATRQELERAHGC
jgi:N-acetylmuramoyl-L-alanine amidase